MDEVHFPKKEFEDLYVALSGEYRREVHAILEDVENKGRRNDGWRSDEELKNWLDRMEAEATARLDALVERYKPRFRAMADEIITIPHKTKRRTNASESTVHGYWVLVRRR